MKKYDDVGQWIRDCKRLTEGEDHDNVVLFSGAEGSGKSTVAFQVMRAIDASFSVERTYFGIPSFLAGAPRAPRGVAVLADEIRLNKRDGMTREVRDLIDFLKDCRALNLHIGLCFPRLGWLDGMAMDRVRWRVDVPRRGQMVVYEQVTRKRRRRGGTEEEYVDWVERGAFRTAANRGRLWDEYLVAKEEHMRSLGERYRLLEDATASEGVGSGGVDHAAAVAWFRELREQSEGPVGARGSIRDGA